MSNQRQIDSQQSTLIAGAEGPEAADSAARLSEARDQLDRIYAAAESILEGIRQGNNERFLEQVRQSGGE